MIQVRHLSKKYGETLALCDVNFDIEAGKIYGFLGTNGAGKSTTMNIITGCLAATSGTVTVDGCDIYLDAAEAKKKIGYLPELPPLYLDMTPFEYLTFVADAKGVPYDKADRQVKEAMELTGLENVAGRLIKNLSKGYRQRVGIAQALLGNPDIIILDEPTVGLDPKQIIEIRELIKNLGQTKTVILSSHILAEISEICDHVIIISHGKLVADDTLEHLEEAFNTSGSLHLTVKGGVDAVQSVLDGIDSVTDYVVESYAEDKVNINIEFDPENDPRETLFYAFSKADMPILNMSADRMTLEDIFLKLTSDDYLASLSEQAEEANKSEEKQPDSENYTPLFAPQEEQEKKEEN